MILDIKDKKGATVYTIPVCNGSTYVWKMQTEEYIQVAFNSTELLNLKKGYYCDIGDEKDPTSRGAIGRFEIISLPQPTASSKCNGYEYDLRMDRPWTKFKNRILFMSRGSVLGMEKRWSLTDKITAHAGILTDNISRCGFNYKGSEYHVVIHEGVDTEKSKVINYDNTSILAALTNIAEAFDTEWWVHEDEIHFGRCEQGEAEIELKMHEDITTISRSEDSSKHGTRLYAYGSDRNLNRNYRRKLKNPFTVNGWHRLFAKTAKIKINTPKSGFRYSEAKMIEFKDGALAGQKIPFTVISGSYGQDGDVEIWDNPVFEISLPQTAEIKIGNQVRFVIEHSTTLHPTAGVTTISNIEREEFYGFSFKDIKLPKKAINTRTAIKFEDDTPEKHIRFLGKITTTDTAGKTSMLNEGRDLYALTDGSAPATQDEQEVTLSHPSMMYVNRLYTEPIDGQGEMAIQGITDNALQLPVGTPYIDSPHIDDEDEIMEVAEQNPSIYPRCLLTITEVTTVDATETNEDTGETTVWQAYRFKAKMTQDGTPFEFDDSYLIQEEGKPLSIQFQSGKLSGLEFEIHFNPEGKKDEKQLFEITRNDNYTLDLPNNIAYPAVGDTLYMFNMDADIIDDTLIAAAEQELKEWAEKEMEKLCRDDGTYTAVNNPVEWGRKRLGVLKKGQKVKLNAPHLVQTADGTRLSRVIGWDLKLNDTTQGEYIIGETRAYSNSENLSNDVQELVYYNGQIKDGSGGVSIQLYDKLIGKLQSKVDSIGGKVDNKLSRVFDDTAKGLITFLKGLLLGDGKHGITEKGVATLLKVITDTIESRNFEKGILGNGFGMWTDADGRSHVETDFLTARIKMVIAALEIMELNYVGGNFIFSPVGGRISSVKPIDNTGAEVADGSTPYAFRCYMVADDGSRRVQNKWKVGDQAKCQTFDLSQQKKDADGVYHDVENKYYWRLVQETGQETLSDGKLYNYIDLSNTLAVTVKYGGETVDGIGYDDGSVTPSVPETGDSIVQMGSQTDRERQSMIVIRTVGDGAPAIDGYSDVNNYNLASHHSTRLFNPEHNFIMNDNFEMKSYTGAVAPMVLHRGSWQEGTPYGHYESVTLDGSTWLCTVPMGHTTTERPSDSSSVWQKYAGKGEKGDSPVMLDIYTDKGNIIRNGQGEITLSAIVTRDGADVTAQYPSEAFSWTRDSGNGEYDTEWNNRHRGAGPSITVRAEDIWKKAVFECVLDTE